MKLIMYLIETENTFLILNVSNRYKLLDRQQLLLMNIILQICLIGNIPIKKYHKKENLRDVSSVSSIIIDSFNTFPGMHASSSSCPNKWHITCFNTD